MLVLAGPIQTSAFSEYFGGGVPDDAPKGLGGSPLNILAREYLRRGRRITLISLDPTVKEDYVLKGNGVSIHYGPFRGNRAHDFFAVEIDYLRRKIEEVKPRFVHAHWTYEYAIAVKRTRFPFMVTAHDAPINVLRRNLIPYRIARTLMAYRAICGCEKLVCVSPYVAGHLRKYMLAGKILDVIPNGLPSQSFVDSGKRRNREEPMIFGTVLPGWNALKNGSAALLAFNEHLQRFPKDGLQMFGHGHGELGPAQEFAEKNGISKNVDFVGELAYASLQERLREQIDVLVHPSLEEAQPMAVIEAMCTGVPVIGGQNSGGVPWTLDHGRAGRLVDVRKPTHIAKEMSLLRSNNNLYEQVASDGLVRAKTTFNIERVADRYEALYEQLVR